MNLKGLLKYLFKPLVQILYKHSLMFSRINDYRYRFGRLPDFMRPKTFTERLYLKMAFDRNPKLTLFADKFLVRGYVEERCGKEILTNIYATIKSAQEMRSLDLPNTFVMKPNHLSGAIKIVKDFNHQSLEELEGLIETWMKRNYSDGSQEWAYKNIKPLVLFEEFIEAVGNVPDDYKFFCFNGVPKFIQIDKNRFSRHVRNIYDTNFSLLPVKYAHDNFENNVNEPKNFNKMLQIASLLSQGMDFVRVDLYNVNGRIVFGELTNYPGGGKEEFDPKLWDEKFASYWKVLWPFALSLSIKPRF